MNAIFRFLAPCLLVLAAFVSQAAGPALAQTDGVEVASTTSAIDYDAWNDAATAAENLISGGVASTTFFEARRADLVRWRAQFLAAQTANEARIETIQAQIDALGPAPEEGESEADAIASRRAELQATLSAAQLPALQADEAFNRANGLITEIDSILSERQQAALLERAPTPLNPVNWATALRAMGTVGTAITSGTWENAQDADVRENFGDYAPIMVVMLLAGFALILRGRNFVARIGARFLDSDSRRGRIALGFVVSLGQLLLPLIGFLLIISALALPEVLSPEAEAISEAVLELVLVLYVALWLAGRLFPDHNERPAAFDASMDRRGAARRVIAIIGVLMGLVNVVQVLAELDLVPEAAQGVFVVPVHIGLSLAYLRLARVLRDMRADLLEGESPNFTPVLLATVATTLRVVAYVGPALGLVGYINAGEALMVPTALTLMIFGLLLALQPVVRDLYAVIFRTSYDMASDALLPVIVNFVLFVLALPLLAITWGVREQRLGELYVRVTEGFTLGDTRITPGVILAVILVFAGGFMATRLLQGVLKSTVLPRTKMDVGARNAVSAGVGYVGIALAAVIAITSAGIDLTALGFVVGALSVGIGFGLQNVVSNFVSGIILLIERPISEGDWIEVNANMGIVKDISVRSTTIETFDKTDVIVPNADFISGTVTNWTRGNTVGRAIVTVGVAYGTDTRRVSDILMEIAENLDGVAKFPAPGVDFLGFGADSLDFRVRVILRDINNLVSVKTEMHHQIAERFAAEGIEIPFAQRDIWLRNPEALAPAHRATPAMDAGESEEAGEDLSDAQDAHLSESDRSSE